MISRKTVKSNASRVQPNQAAHHAYHWSLVGSFHHGMLFTVSTAAITHTSSSTCCFTRPRSSSGLESGNNEVWHHLDVFGLGTEQQSYNKVNQPEHCARRHRDREAEVPRRVGREKRQNRWHQPAGNRADVVAKG